MIFSILLYVKINAILAKIHYNIKAGENEHKHQDYRTVVGLCGIDWSLFLNMYVSNFQIDDIKHFNLVSLSVLWF